MNDAMKGMRARMLEMKKSMTEMEKHMKALENHEASEGEDEDYMQDTGEAAEAGEVGGASTVIRNAYRGRK